MSLKVSIPARIPILYVILGVLVAISVVPMYFYSAQVERHNRERLKTNEKLLQNTVTRSLADDISQHEASLRLMLAICRPRSRLRAGETSAAPTSSARNCVPCWRILFRLPTTLPTPPC